MFTSKELPLYGCNLWFASDIQQCKELKHLVEGYGGKVCSRLSGKVNFVVAKRRTDDLDTKIGKYTLSVIPEHFIRESVKTNTPLPLFTSHFGDLQQKENLPNQLFPSSLPPSSSGLPYSPSYPMSSSNPTPPTQSKPSIRTRLRGLSLKSKKPKQPSPPLSTSSPELSPTPSPSSPAKERMRLRAICESLHMLPAKKHQKEEESEKEKEREKERERERWAEAGKPLHGLVFVIYGTFSMPREVVEQLIVEYGGTYVPNISDKVTHLLFGGEDMETSEYLLAKEQNIHIVNEYFLRLLIKY